jgi:hypothetical protein
MKFEQVHSLGKEEARRRLEQLTRAWQTRHGVAVTWSGDTAQLNGSVRGVSFNATFTVGERAIEAAGTDPGLLMRAVTIAYLKKKLLFYLDPSRSAQDLERGEV